MSDQSPVEIQPFRKKYDFDETFPFGEGEFVRIQANKKDLQASLEREHEKWGSKNDYKWDLVKRTKFELASDSSGSIFSRKKIDILRGLPFAEISSRIGIPICKMHMERVIRETAGKIEGLDLSIERRNSLLTETLRGFWHSTRFALIAEANEWSMKRTLDQSWFQNAAGVLDFAIMTFFVSKSSDPGGWMFMAGFARLWSQNAIIIGAMFLGDNRLASIREANPLNIPKLDDPLPFEITFEK